MVNILEFLESRIVILTIALIVLIIIIITLFLIQKKLKKKIDSKEKEVEKESTLIKEIEVLKSSKENPENNLKKLNSLARNFLEDELKIKKSQDYGEIITTLKQKNKPNIINFCQKMLEALYSGEKTDKRKVDILINNLEKLILNQHPKITIKKEIIPQKKESILIIPKKTESTTNLNREGVIKQLNKIDEEQIKDAYKQLQELFEKTYETTKKDKDKKNIAKLEEFRKLVLEEIKDYSQNPSQTRKFAKEINAGAKFLKSILSKNY